MKKFKYLVTVICSSVALLYICLFVSACAEDSPDPLPYNAVLFDKAERWAQEDFLSENKTHFPSENDNLPLDRCFVIDSDEKFSRAFDSFPEEVAFEQDMLVVYFFTDIYYGFDCKLQTITQNEGEITIDILHEMAEQRPDGARPPSTSMPMQRCLVIKLSGCNYESVQVEMNYS